MTASAIAVLLLFHGLDGLGLDELVLPPQNTCFHGDTGNLHAATTDKGVKGQSAD